MDREETSLNSIIRAAREMAARKNTAPETDAAPKTGAVPEADAAHESDAAIPGTDPALPPDFLLRQTAGIHFLEFAVAFLTLSKCQYQQSNNLKVNSLPFFALIALDSWADSDFTMSELAGKLQITKQQLTRLINVLEERGLVERIHDTANRRRVYIRIRPSGRLMMDEVKRDMLASTLHGLRAYSARELEELDSCICRLTALMGKFDTDPPPAP